MTSCANALERRNPRTCSSICAVCRSLHRDAIGRLSLNEGVFWVKIVRMTRLSKSKLSTSKGGKGRPPKGRSGYWLLQDAKARFSELVRKVRSEGPQHVTVHGRDAVVVISAEEFRRLKGVATGRALIDAVQASPYRDLDIEPARAAMP